MKQILKYCALNLVVFAAPIHAVTWKFVNNIDQAIDIEMKLGPGRFAVGTGKQRTVYFFRTTKKIKNLHPNQSDRISDHNYCVSLQGGKGYDLFDLKIKPSSTHEWNRYGVRFTRTHAQYDHPTANHSCTDATITILSLEKATPAKAVQHDKKRRYGRKTVSNTQREYTFILGLQEGI